MAAMLRVPGLRAVARPNILRRANAMTGVRLIDEMAAVKRARVESPVEEEEDSVEEEPATQEEEPDVDAEMQALMDEAPKGKGSKSEVFLLTVFAYQSPAQQPLMRDYCRYIKCQQERAPTTGKLHWQTVVVLRQRDKWSTVANRMEAIIGKRTFVQAVSSKASGYIRARKYCGKLATRAQADIEPEEWGVWPFDEAHRQGKRTDIQGAYDFAQANPFAGQREFAEAGHLEAWVKYPRLMTGQVADIAEMEFSAPVAFWFWGPTGTGKTHRARELAKTFCRKNAGWKAYSRKSHDRNEWPGYTGQQVVIWDEFREVNPHQSLGSILTILDRGNPTYVNQKYAGMFMLAKVHIFTAPTHPENAFFHGVGEHQGQIDQLVRRITQERIIHCANVFNYQGPAEPSWEADDCVREMLEANPL